MATSRPAPPCGIRPSWDQAVADWDTAALAEGARIAWLGVREVIEAGLPESR